MTHSPERKSPPPCSTNTTFPLWRNPESAIFPLGYIYAARRRIFGRRLLRSCHKSYSTCIVSHERAVTLSNAARRIASSGLTAALPLTTREIAVRVFPKRHSHRSSRTRETEHRLFQSRSNQMSSSATEGHRRLCSRHRLASHHTSKGAG